MNVKMSLRRLTLVAAALALIAPLAANAQPSSDTQSGTASAQVVAAIAISQNVGLDFGDVVASATAGTVAMSVGGVRTASDGATLGNAGGAAGSFTVTGESTATYTLTLPTAAIILDGPDTAEMTVTTFTHDSQEQLTAGTETFEVGATLNVGISQVAGAYTGTYPITVTYN